MSLTENIVYKVASNLDKTKVKWLDNDIEITRSFNRMTMLDAIHGGPSPEKIREKNHLDRVLSSNGVDCSNMSHGKMVMSIFERLVEPNLIQPTFIYDFPSDVSPLSRKKSEDPWLVDRFELFIGGREFANGFSELNDPVDQEQRFNQQLADRSAGDEEAHLPDIEYVKALEAGMPPTAGLGIGIDRLVMLLTESNSIKDVILFPLMKN